MAICGNGISFRNGGWSLRWENHPINGGWSLRESQASQVTTEPGSPIFGRWLCKVMYTTFIYFLDLASDITSSTAQGGGGSFKNRKPIGEIGCCESGMAERIHWWSERCLRSPLFLSLSLTIYLPIYLLCIYLSTYLSIYLSIYIYLYLYLSIYLSLSLSFI